MATILAALKAFAALFGFGEKVVAEVHDKNQRDAGATAQRDKDNTDELDAMRKGNAAAGDPAAIEHVRDEYELKRP